MPRPVYIPKEENLQNLLINSFINHLTGFSEKEKNKLTKILQEMFKAFTEADSKDYKPTYEAITVLNDFDYYLNRDHGKVEMSGKGIQAKIIENWYMLCCYEMSCPDSNKTKSGLERFNDDFKDQLKEDYQTLYDYKYDFLIQSYTYKGNILASKSAVDGCFTVYNSLGENNPSDEKLKKLEEVARNLENTVSDENFQYDVTGANADAINSREENLELPKSHVKDELNALRAEFNRSRQLEYDESVIKLRENILRHQSAGTKALSKRLTELQKVYDDLNEKYVSLDDPNAAEKINLNSLKPLKESLSKLKSDTNYRLLKAGDSIFKNLKLDAQELKYTDDMKGVIDSANSTVSEYERLLKLAVQLEKDLRHIIKDKSADDDINLDLGMNHHVPLDDNFVYNDNKDQKLSIIKEEDLEEDLEEEPNEFLFEDPDLNGSVVEDHKQPPIGEEDPNETLFEDSDLNESVVKDHKQPPVEEEDPNEALFEDPDLNGSVVEDHKQPPVGEEDPKEALFEDPILNGLNKDKDQKLPPEGKFNYELDIRLDNEPDAQNRTFDDPDLYGNVDEKADENEDEDDKEVKVDYEEEEAIRERRDWDNLTAGLRSEIQTFNDNRKNTLLPLDKLAEFAKCHGRAEELLRSNEVSKDYKDGREGTRNDAVKDSYDKLSDSINNSGDVLSYRDKRTEFFEVSEVIKDTQNRGLFANHDLFNDMTAALDRYKEAFSNPRIHQDKDLRRIARDTKKACLLYLNKHLEGSKDDQSIGGQVTADGIVRKQAVVKMLELMTQLPEFTKQAEPINAPGIKVDFKDLNFDQLKSSLAENSSIMNGSDEEMTYGDLNKAKAAKAAKNGGRRL